MKKMIKKIFENHKDKFYFVFRVLVGILFFQHGAQKLFGWFTENPSVELFSLIGLAGIIEFFGGLAIALGLFTSFFSLVSALTKIPVRRFVGMTGEVTLRGRVLEIGGVKEKVIAAHRAGLKTIIMPKNNKKDLEDIPKYVIDELEFVFVEQMDEVLKVALVQLLPVIKPIITSPSIPKTLQA